jgi:transposase-like protein
MVGKLNNGRCESLGVDIFGRNNYRLLFENFKKRGIKRIKIILSSLLYQRYIQGPITDYFPETKIQWCLGTIYSQFLGEFRSKNDKDVFEYINRIFSAKTLSQAKQFTEEGIADFNKSIVKERLTRWLPMIEVLLKYTPKYRKIICTNIIISYLSAYLQLLLDKKVFANVPEALSYIKFTSDLILKNGEYYIPHWNILSSKVDQ